MSLSQLFAMQQQAADNPGWPKLRATLDERNGMPVFNQCEYTLRVYANGILTWEKKKMVEGSSRPRQIADELLTQVFTEAAFAGLCHAARYRRKLNRCLPYEATDSLPDKPHKNELLPITR